MVWSQMSSSLQQQQKPDIPHLKSILDDNSLTFAEKAIRIKNIETCRRYCCRSIIVVCFLLSEIVNSIILLYWRIESNTEAFWSYIARERLISPWKNFSSLIVGKASNKATSTLSILYTIFNIALYECYTQYVYQHDLLHCHSWLPHLTRVKYARYSLQADLHTFYHYQKDGWCKCILKLVIR